MKKQLFLAFMAILMLALAPCVAQAETAQQQADQILGSAGGGDKSSSYTCDEAKILGVESKVNSLDARLLGNKKVRGILPAMQENLSALAKAQENLSKTQEQQAGAIGRIETQLSIIGGKLDSTYNKVDGFGEIIERIDKNARVAIHNISMASGAAYAVMLIGFIFLNVRLGRARDEFKAAPQQPKPETNAG